jgi:hypothetical protein
MFSCRGILFANLEGKGAGSSVPSSLRPMCNSLNSENRRFTTMGRYLHRPWIATGGENAATLLSQELLFSVGMTGEMKCCAGSAKIFR